MEPYPKLSLIVALGEQRGIGIQGRLPWRVPEDLKRFKQLTMHQIVVMGRKTYESLPGPLQGRKIIVLTHQKNYPAKAGTTVVNDPQAILSIARNERVWIAGGEQIYEIFLPYAQTLHISRIAGEEYLNPACDAKFPQFAEEEYEKTSSEEFKGNPGHTYEIFERRA